MTSLPTPTSGVETAAAGRRLVVGGIDTHKDLHVAAVLDASENVLGTASFSTTRAGYRALVRWLHGFGAVAKVGVEGTGSFGAGIARHLTALGIETVEVDRPDRGDRRRKGKDDDLDAINAARAALRGQRTSVPKSKDGKVEALRVLRVTRTTAVKVRRAALQMLRAQIISAPEELRDQVRNLTRMQLIRTCAAWRPDVSDAADAVTATRIALKSLARRILDLGDEISMLDELITPLVTDLAPRLLERPGIGIEIAGQLLVTAGDNPQRCAASPRSRCSAASRRCPPRPGRPDGTGSTTRRPAGQPRPAPRRHQPPADGPADEGLRRETHRARAQQAGDDSVPQALPRPRGLLPAQPRPAPNGREKDQNCGLTNRRVSAAVRAAGAAKAALVA